MQFRISQTGLLLELRIDNLPEMIYGTQPRFAAIVADEQVLNISRQFYITLVQA